VTTPHAPNTGPPACSPEEFLRHFPGAWVQYFDDSPLKDRRKALATPHFDAEEAKRKQQVGCGVFFSPNAFDSQRRVDNLRQIQAVYVDCDLRHEGESIPDDEFRRRLDDAAQVLVGCNHPPHAIIRTKNGLQAIWCVEPTAGPEAVNLFHETEGLLINHFDADPAAKDVTRVLRLPGFLHLKNPADPFPCTLLYSALGLKPYRLADLRDWLRVSPAATGSDSVGQRPAKRWALSLSGVAQGGRNNAAAAVAGKLLAQLDKALWETAGWNGLKEWNGRNAPPLAESELRAVFESIAGREHAKRRAAATADKDEAGRAQADKLVDLASAERAVFFLDQLAVAQTSVPVGEHRETWRVRSKMTRMWLSSLLWRAEGRAPSTNALTAALTVLEGQAFFGGQRFALHNRVAWHDGTLWYDLTNERWEAVRVTSDGWEVVKNPPILFHRHTHVEPQLVPKTGGDPRALLRFVNVTDTHQQVLLLVYLVSCFLPDIPHPVALLYGPHGSAKTTLARMLRCLIDPSTAQVIALPPTLTSLVQHLSHHWYASFDNVSDLPEWASDALCRAVTGAGFSKRELYTDDEDVLYAFRRCVGLNGINVSARKADLLDRSLLFRLGRLPAESRRSERALWAEFEAARPAILGGIFDALSAALRLHPGRELPASPRMADFAEWGNAITEALGFPSEEFHAAYQANQREQHEEAISENVVAWVLMAFMDDRPVWEGSPAELLRSLTALADRDRINTRSAAWPALPNSLMRRLNEARANLAEVGIVFDSRKATHGRRLIRLQRVAVAPVPPPSTRNTGGDAHAQGGDALETIATRKNRSAKPQTREGGDGGDDDRNSLPARPGTLSPAVNFISPPALVQNTDPPVLPSP